MQNPRRQELLEQYRDWNAMFDWFVSAFYEILLRLTENYPQTDAGTDREGGEGRTARKAGMGRHRSRQIGQSRLEVVDSTPYKWDIMTGDGRQCAKQMGQSRLEMVEMTPNGTVTSGGGREGPKQMGQLRIKMVQRASNKRESKV